MPIIDVEQQTPEWIRMRIGMATASRVKDIVKRLSRASNGKKAGDYAQCHEDYLWELVAERLTGRAADHYVTPYMEEGTENEPLAKAAYEVQFDVSLENGGFAVHDRIKWFGASPDALVGTDGLIECKCLKTVNHLEILRTGQIPEEHLAQMLAEMSCADRQWCDFISFDPRVPKPLQLFVRRMHRDETLVAQMETEVEAFLAEVEEAIEKLKTYPAMIVQEEATV